MIPFHRLLISTAILFCAGFAAWMGWRYKVSGTPGALVLSLAFLAASGGLGYYLRHLKRFLGR